MYLHSLTRSRKLPLLLVSALPLSYQELNHLKEIPYRKEMLIFFTHTNIIYFLAVFPDSMGWPVHGFVSRQMHDFGLWAKFYGQMPFMAPTILVASYNTQGYCIFYTDKHGISVIIPLKKVHIWYHTDCGAGIGRVSKHLLSSEFELVDLLEQNSQFLDKANTYMVRKN